MKWFKRNIKTSILILLTLFFHSYVTGQYSWTNYNIVDGMYNNNAITVNCDRYGIVWIGLGHGTFGDGLQRFDGSSWVFYNTLNSGLVNNAINKVLSDGVGNIWIIYFGGALLPSGLTKFDGTNWTTFDTLNSQLISNDIRDFYIDNYNQLWLSCSGGISKFDGITFTNYPIPYSGTILFEDSTSIWIAGNGLTHFNPQNGLYSNFTPANSGLLSYNVKSIAKDTTGLYWIGEGWYGGGVGNGGGNGLVATFNGINFTSIFPFASPYTWPKEIVIDKSNRIWIAAQGEGVYLFDAGIWTLIPSIVPSALASDIDVDKDNNIWIAEYNYGIWTNKTIVGIAENSVLNWEIFPNPSVDEINFKGNFFNNDILEFYDIFGHLIFKSKIESNCNTFKIHCKELMQRGVVIFQITRQHQMIFTSKINLAK